MQDRSQVPPTPERIQIVAERIDQARSAPWPKVAASVYRLDETAISSLPQGDSTPLNKALLQVPGVVQGDHGALYVRGEMVQPQYRINGVIVPEGISGFAQVFDTRSVAQIDFLAGALPAQYGYRTAGVVDIRMKDGLREGGVFALHGGSHGTLNPSFQLGGTKGPMSFYVTGNVLKTDLGILSPTPDRVSIHNRSEQSNGFGYISYALNPATRISAILGSTIGRFQIPNNPGQTPTFPLDGIGLYPDISSAGLDERQREVNRYAIVAWQSNYGARLDYQLALFTRYSSVLFEPDPLGDLLYSGVASRVSRDNLNRGIQGDASYRPNPRHTVRFGFGLSGERTQSGNIATVFPADAAGNQVPGLPIAIVDNHSKSGAFFGSYIQDEWRLGHGTTLNYGLRVDRVDAFVRASQLSPRLGVVHEINPQAVLHAGYARYFTPPRLELVASTTLQEFLNTTNAPKTTQNSNVVPERMHYLDLGGSYRPIPELKLGVDGYYKYARHLGDYGQFGQALVFTPFNWDRARIYGLEVTASYRKGHVTAYLNLARTMARGKRIESGQFNFDPDELAYIDSRYVHLDHDQRYTASGGVSYARSATTFSANFIYGSGMRRGFANLDSMAPYLQIDLGVIYRFAAPDSGKWSARVSVVNLFDRIYEIRDGSGIGVGAPQFGPRRSVYAGVSREL